MNKKGRGEIRQFWCVKKYRGLKKMSIFLPFLSILADFLVLLKNVRKSPPKKRVSVKQFKKACRRLKTTVKRKRAASCGWGGDAEKRHKVSSMRRLVDGGWWGGRCLLGGSRHGVCRQHYCHPVGAHPPTPRTPIAPPKLMGA